MLDRRFWKAKKVLVTGHTGFKGSWLCLWLHSLGAKVTGYSLDPPTEPSLFSLANVDKLVNSVIADVRDHAKLVEAFSENSPEIVIHLAAQSIVRTSYLDPLETYSTNVMGTVNLLEAVRNCQSVKAVINVTTDKCYENKEWLWGYRENDRLGGHDPYSNSKACSELITSAYRSSYFQLHKDDGINVGVATARAGNVIGGGDWAKDRLVSDCVRALLKSENIIIRNPYAVRPWQHVFEPLSGYLLLAQKLFKDAKQYSSAWNFGPNENNVVSVETIVNKICEKWTGEIKYNVDDSQHPHEARLLKLDSSKAQCDLGWHPKWNLDRSIGSVVEWFNAYREGKKLLDVCLLQIEEYEKTRA